MVKPPFRTKTLGTKVSEEEFAQLESAASERGLTLSEWCRETLLSVAGFDQTPIAVFNTVSDELHVSSAAIICRAFAELFGYGRRSVSAEARSFDTAA